MLALNSCFHCTRWQSRKVGKSRRTSANLTTPHTLPSYLSHPVLSVRRAQQSTPLLHVDSLDTDEQTVPYKAQKRIHKRADHLFGKSLQSSKSKYTKTERTTQPGTMAITKTPKISWGASATLPKEPWVIEHERSLATHGPTASTNHIYSETVHRGFDAHFTAEDFTRRYPIFEEIESHREFLVQSRSARLFLPKEKDNCFTPEQLWEEDDRLRGVNQFARSGEASWVDEVEDETEDEENEGQAVEQRIVVQEESDDEQDENFDLPHSFDFEDHATTITANYSQVEDVFASIGLLTTASSKTITSSFVDGRLAIAICGREKSDATTSTQLDAEAVQRVAHVNGDSSSHPTGLDNDAAGHNQATPNEAADEVDTTSDEWNMVLKDSTHPTVALLSGAKTLSALMAAVDLHIGTTVAIIQKYSDGKVVVILAGQQRAKEAPFDLDYASLWAEFFRTVQKATRHGAFPMQHVELASLLRAAGRDLVKAGLLDDFVLPVEEEEEGVDGLRNKASISDAALAIAAGQGDLSDQDFVEVLKEQIKETQRALDVARKDTQPSLSYSPTRMLALLERPSVDYEALERAEKHRTALAAVDMASTHLQTAALARPLRNPMLAHGAGKKTRPARHTAATMPATRGLAPPSGSTTSRKRSRDASTPPSDSSPDPQKTKKRKVAAARNKGRGKA